ncbi:hypothetical protein HJFPF1_12200 [Paramyrothecium foliicola]|nr:hypothetical protein HJFPF1_12200 [Paramyrothecium foliicola]
METTASIAGLIGLAGTAMCIDLYDIFATACDTSGDVQSLAHPLLEEDHSSTKRIGHTKRLLSRYTSLGKPQFLASLRRRTRAGPSSAANSHNLELPEVTEAINEALRLDFLKDRSLINTTVRAVKWATADKKEADRALALLRQHNVSLATITDQFEQLRSRFQRGFDAASSGCNIPSTLGGTSGNQQDRAQRLEEISEIGIAIGQIGLGYDEEPSSHVVDASPQIMDHDTYLNSSKLQIPDSDVNTSANPLCSYGHYDNAPVVMEWRYHSSRITEEGQSLLDARVALLVSMLRRSKSISTFRTLPCRGLSK